MTMNLFIDTNILLLFFDFTNEDLDQLDMLTELIRHEQIRLYMPEQVEDEFYRNREGKISDALKKFKESIEVKYPHMCRPYPEYKKLQKLAKLYEKNKSTLYSKLLDDIYKSQLKADITIKSLLKSATRIKRTQ